MKFSIITPSFNMLPYLKLCHNSIMDQNHSNYEHIIIDGESTDGTLEIIDKYKKSISSFISEKDMGMYYAMNKGIDLASGDIIGILNSDDYFYDDALEVVKSYFERKSEIDFLFGSVHKFSLRHGFFPKKICWTFNFYTTHSVGFFIKKTSQKKLGYYNTKYKYSSDYDLFYRMIVKNKMVGTATKKNEVLGFFNPYGFSSTIRYIDYLKENTQIRLDNGQNKIIVWSIHFLRLSKRIFRVIKELKK